jgi:glycosyltransferase involved in cell wall biosynthesis
MKIAIYHNLPSGGAKRTLHDSVQRLAARHSIDVYTLSCANHTFGDLRPFAARHEVFPFQPLPLFRSPLGRLNQVVRLADLLRLRLVTRRVAALIQSRAYDLVFVQPCQFEKAPSVLRDLGGVPTVYYCHESLRVLYEQMPARPYDKADSSARQMANRLDPLPALYQAALRRSDQMNIHGARRVLVNSIYVQQVVQQVYGIGAQVSYHGVDEQLFQPARSESTRSEQQRMVLSVGSLTPLKGFDFILRALAHLPVAQRPRLVIVSNFQNPPEKAYLQGLAHEVGVETEFLLNVSDERLATLYNQAALTVYAPVREPFGLVPLESMACGTPVVAVREGGVGESVLHEQTGLLVERDEQAFAAAVARLLDDPALAQAYGEHGRAHVLAQWTWERAMRTLEDHFRATLAPQGTEHAAAPTLAH